jgi:hypothetical protein
VRAAQGREATALAVTVEEVLQVEGGHVQAARHRRHRRALQFRQLQRAFDLQARMALRVHAHDALHVAQLHAGAQHRVARQVGHAGRVAGIAAIVQHQAAALVVGHHLLIAGSARRGHFGRLPEAAIEGHGELAEALQAVGTGQGQRRGDAHALAIQRAPVGRRGGQHHGGAAARAEGDAAGAACGWAWARRRPAAAGTGQGRGTAAHRRATPWKRRTD